MKTARQKPDLHLELYQQDVNCGMRTPDRVLWQSARDISRAFDAGDEGLRQRDDHEDAEEKHADRCAPREGARGERRLWFSGREQTSVTLPALSNTNLKACEEQSVVIMSSPGHNVDVVARL